MQNVDWRKLDWLVDYLSEKLEVKNVAHDRYSLRLGLMEAANIVYYEVDLENVELDSALGTLWSVGESDHLKSMHEYDRSAREALFI